MIFLCYLKKKAGMLVIISGPSGSGKGTIINELSMSNEVSVSVSATTRLPRPNERNGVQYKFLDKKQFFKQVESGNILEYNEYCGNFYGTIKSDILSLLNKNKYVILEVDVNGAKKVCEKIKAVTIFVMPPSLEVLKQRLLLRNTETQGSVCERLLEAKRELQSAINYDYFVVNDNLNYAISVVRSIMVAEKHKMLKDLFELNPYFKYLD